MDDSGIFGDPTLSSWLKSTFEILSRWTHGEIREADAAELDRIRSNFDEAAGLFTRTALASRQLFHQRLAKLETKLEKRDVRIRPSRPNWPLRETRWPQSGAPRCGFDTRSIGA